MSLQKSKVAVSKFVRRLALPDAFVFAIPRLAGWYLVDDAGVEPATR